MWCKKAFLFEFESQCKQKQHDQRTSTQRKATVEQIIASEEMNKSKRAGLSESHRGLREGELTKVSKTKCISTWFN